MRHEIVGDFVVRIVEKDIHLPFASVHGVTCAGADLRKQLSPHLLRTAFGLAISACRKPFRNAVSYHDPALGQANARKDRNLVNIAHF